MAHFLCYRILRVANFGFNYLRHFFIKFGNSCANLAANFLNFSNYPNILSLECLMGVVDTNKAAWKAWGCESCLTTGCPVCLVLKQGAVNQLFLEVFLMFLACLDHKWWAQFHLGILGPQEWKKSSEILSWKKVRFQGCLKLTYVLIYEYGGLPTLGSIISDNFPSKDQEGIWGLMSFGSYSF